MNRMISALTTLGGLVLFPLVDSAIKGTVVLLLAGAVCFLLRRDSAATRHFVWSTSAEPAPCDAVIVAGAAGMADSPGMAAFERTGSGRRAVKLHPADGSVVACDDDSAGFGFTPMAHRRASGERDGSASWQTRNTRDQSRHEDPTR